MSQYISLHNHSHYSILDALPSPKDLLIRAKELGQSSIAITDHGTFGGIWNAYKSSKEVGVKLIVGAEFYFLNDASKKEDKIRHLVLLAKNAIGYKNLLSLHYKGFDNALSAGRKVIPIIDWSLLKSYNEGIICLTGSGNGIIASKINAKNFDEAEQDLNKLVDIFGKNHLGVEIQPHTLTRNPSAYSNGINQIFTNYQLIKLANKLQLKIIPTSNTHYLTKEEAELHDIFLAIGAMQPVYSNARLRYNVPDLYLKSADEIKAFFSRNFGMQFANEICENTVYFANQCEEPKWIDPKFSNPSGKELPTFPVKDEVDYNEFIEWKNKQSEEVKNLAEDKAFLRYRCDKAFKEFKKKISIEKRAIYIDRLNSELDVIEYKDISSYLLIVADYVNWAKNNGVSVGVGRGSVGGGLSAFLLGIHSADPIKYGLVFERFYNKKKNAYSDIDLDFAKNSRQKVIDYITNKYGREYVAQISNIVRITPKVYVRDIARSLEFGSDRKKAVEIGNNIADSFLAKYKSFSEICTNAPLFVEYTKRYPQLLKYKQICDKPRGAGVHAAGIIIGSRPLSEITPLRKDKDGASIVEYDKDDAEDNGLVKMDILGLSTLDIIDATNDLIKKAGKQVPNIDYDIYDQKTYDLITEGDTFGVFQFGTSAGTIDLCKKIKPRNIEDLAIITTLARPASQEIREDFIKTRAGKRAVKLMHPSLDRALKNTYGYPLYDESLLILAKDVAGWDLDEADKLRKLTKEKGKNPKKVEIWHKEFIEGAIKNNISEEMANKIWVNIIEPYGRYSFNKSHAVLYSMISYHTAYLKAHFPIEFLLANLTSEIKSNAPDAEVNIDKAKQELRRRGVNILPPDINKSEMSYKLIEKGNLLTGIEALKFVGEDAIEDILEKRPFKNFHDFMVRSDTKKMRASAIQALAASGCLDVFNIPRKLMYLYCSDYRKKLQVWLKRHDPNTDQFDFPWPENSEWNKSELYALEKYYLGEAFICSKKEAFGSFFNQKHINLSFIKNCPDKTPLPSIRAEIKSIFELKVKKVNSRYFGQDMCKVSIEDEFGTQAGLTIFPDRWKEIKNKIKMLDNKTKFEIGFGIHFSGTCNIYENESGIILENLYEIVPPPALPRDLKAKKINIKSDDTKLESATMTSTAKGLIDELEDEILNEGFVNLDEDPFAFDI